MTVLITGAAGFAGQHLTAWLAGKNDVHGTLYGRQSPPNRYATYHCCDMENSAAVHRLIRRLRPDRVFHLAALTSPYESFKKPELYYRTNFLGTTYVLDAVRKYAPDARVLVVSSAHAYGRVNSSRLPVKETEELRPESPYGVSKAAAELAAVYFGAKHGTHIVRARPFNHTGPGQSPQFVCSDWARQLAAAALGRQRRLQVGNLEVKRDFSDVRDVVRTYAELVDSGRAGEAYNICSGKAISMKQILQLLLPLAGGSVEVRITQRRVRTGEPDALFGSTRRLRRDTVGKPRYSMQQTMKDLYYYWLEQLQSTHSRLSRSLP